METKIIIYFQILKTNTFVITNKSAKLFAGNGGPKLFAGKPGMDVNHILIANGELVRSGPTNQAYVRKYTTHLIYFKLF